jgi:hypothetical protein
MNETEILELIEHIEKTYPRYYLLNESTIINNILLYKLIKSLDIFRNKTEILELIEHIEKTYPRYYLLNENTEINNILLYKLIEAVKTLMK